MKNILNLLFAVSMFVVATAGIGCDLGTYQQRANAPIPSNTAKAGDVGTSQPAAEDETDQEESSE